MKIDTVVYKPSNNNKYIWEPRSIINEFIGIFWTGSHKNRGNRECSIYTKVVDKDFQMKMASLYLSNSSNEEY